MNIMELGALGEFVGSIGVIATLIYLAVQIRHNTHSVRATVFQEFSRESSQMAHLLVSDGAAGPAFMRGLAQPQDLDPAEVVRFRVLINLYFRNLQNGFHQQRNGLIEDELFESYVSYGLERVLRQPGALEFWSKNQQHFTPAFSRWLNSRLAA